MRMRFFLTAALVLAFVLSGCDAASPDSSDTISGRWTAIYRGNEIEIEFLSSGSRLTGGGTWRTDGGADVVLSLDGVYEHPDVAFEVESLSAPFVVDGVFEGVDEDDRRIISGHFGASQYLTFYRR